MPAGLVSRPLAAMAVGCCARRRTHRLARRTGVARYLHEWEGEARGAITLRQLLEDTSGLETGGDTRDCSTVRRGTSLRACRDSQPARACDCC